MSDPREELSRLIYEGWMDVPWDQLGNPFVSDVRACAIDAADAVLAAGWVKLSDLASDPEVIEKVARYIEKTYFPLDYLKWDQHDQETRDARLHGARFYVSVVAAALAATPEKEEGS